VRDVCRLTRLHGHTTSTIVLTGVNAFWVQVQNGLENVFAAFFAGFNPVSHIMITGGCAVIQVKHLRDINLKLSVYF